MTYYASSGTLNPTHSLTHIQLQLLDKQWYGFDSTYLHESIIPPSKAVNS